MHRQSILPTWLSDTPLRIPLSYFSTLQQPGVYIYREADSVLYSYANQLFGWGAFPTRELTDKLRSLL